MSTQVGVRAIDRRKTSSENDLISQATTPRTYQNVNITDIISEGPIEGLVEGGSSIFLNGDPLFGEGEAPFVPSVTLKASGTSGQNTISLNAPTSQTKGVTNLFVGIEEAVTGSVSISNAGSDQTPSDAGYAASINSFCMYIDRF